MQTRLSITLEIISALVVVISLVFVGLEIRNSTEQTEQNTRTLQVSAYQDLISRIVDLNMIAIEESVTIETLVAIDSPTSTETQRLNSFLWILFRHGDMAYFQYENGSISEERMLSAMNPLLLRLSDPKIRSRWNAVKGAFVPAYSNYIDSKIARL
ncbi:MAG: hypothetical protein ABJ084_08205 [Halioglobus sp.]